MAQSILEIVLRAKDEASSKLKGLADHAGTIGKGFTVAGGAITGAMALAVKGAIDAEQSAAKVNTTLAAMGEKGLKAKDAINAAAGAAVKLGFDDEAAAESITNLFQRTGDLNTAMEYNQLAMDLAAKKGISLEEASAKVGMMAMGNAKAFKELGIEINKDTNISDAMSEAQKRLAGQAEAAAGTTAGQMAVLKESFANVSDEVGKVLLPVINDLVKKIQPVIEKVMQWIQANPELAKKIVIVTAAVGGILVVLGPLLIALPAIVAGVTAFGAVLAFIISPIGLVVLAIAGIGVAIFLLIKNWDLVKAKTMEVWDAIVGKVQSAVDSIVGKINKVKDAIKGIGGKAASILGFGDEEHRAFGGGVNTGQPYIVGERGPELFVPSSRGNIMPNGGGSSSNHYWNISVRNDNDLRELVDTVNRVLGNRTISEQFGGAG